MPNIQITVTSFPCKKWTVARERTGSPEISTVSPLWKLYFNPLGLLCKHRCTGIHLPTSLTIALFQKQVWCRLFFHTCCRASGALCPLRSGVDDDNDTVKLTSTRQSVTMNSDALPLWLQLQLDRSIAKHLEKGLYCQSCSGSRIVSYRKGAGLR